MSLDVVDYVVAGGATLLAGGINGVAGGGTLISFPALLAIGVPALGANVTNTVALCPGYLSGTYAARADLGAQRRRARRLAPFAGVGGVLGALLLQVTPEATFRAVVPWLVLLATALLFLQERVRAWVADRRAGSAEGEGSSASPVLCAAVLAGSVYGGFFGAGLGIMLLAVLGVLCADDLVRLNAVKQMITLIVNVLAAVLFAVTGHVDWRLVPVMAVAALVGGGVGSRLAQRVDPTWLRRVVVVFGLAVAIELWVTG